METIIDCEPTWGAILKGVELGHFEAKELMPAAKIADIVRQAQKKGYKQVIFSFPNKNGDVKVTEVE